MAIITSHILDSVSGTHAKGVRVDLIRIDSSDIRKVLVKTSTDQDGRIKEVVAAQKLSPDCLYELVFYAAEYHATQRYLPGRISGLEQVVIRFAISDAAARYHIPLMLAPCSYSVWLSDVGS